MPELPTEAALVHDVDHGVYTQGNAAQQNRKAQNGGGETDDRDVHQGRFAQ
jgi:hypothetical protein